MTAQETIVQPEEERGTSMKKYLSYIVALIGLTFSLSSCHTSAPRLDYKALAKASVRMGIDINKEDNHQIVHSLCGVDRCPPTAQAVTTNAEQIVRTGITTL